MESAAFGDDLSLYLDSIEFVKLIIEIENEFSIEYPAEKMIFEESNTIDKISEIIESSIEIYQ